MIGKEEISETLSKIKYPGYDQDIVTFGVVKEIGISGDEVTIVIDQRSPDQKVVNLINESIRMQIAGV